ncbi:MAG: DUF5995 family protein [Melioribacteraceae bacterium]|nr:DUF5995 family protein [Melioribacteraceae bacterium]
MNAHINYDLPICVYDIMNQFNDLAPGEIPIPFDRGLNNILQKRYFDFLMINQIAWESIELIQDVLCERFSKAIRILNKLSFNVSKKLVEQIIVEYRDKAWGNSIILLSTKDSAELKEVKTFVDRVAVKNILLVKNKLSFNPIVLTNNLRGKSHFQIPIEKDKLGSDCINILIQKLINQNTSDFAYRTLLDYGEEIISYIELFINSENIFLRKKIISLLIELDSKISRDILSTQIGKEYNPELKLEILKHLTESAIKTNRNYNTSAQIEELLKSQLKEYFKSHLLLMYLKNFEPKQLFSEMFNRFIDREKKLISYSLALILKDKEFFNKIENNDSVEFKNRDNILNRFNDTGTKTLLEFFTASRTKLDKESLHELLKINKEDYWELMKTKVSSNKNYFQNTLLLCAASAFKTNNSLEFLFNMNNEDNYKDAVYWNAKRLQNDKSLNQKYSEVIENILNNEDTKMLSSIEKVLHFKNVSLFQEVPAEYLINLARSSSEKHFSEGELIITQGSYNNDLILIIEGIVSVNDKDGNKISTIRKNSVVGEMSLLTDSVASADCIAESEVKSLVIPHSTFKNYLIQYTEISYGLMKVLAQKLTETNKMITESFGYYIRS